MKNALSASTLFPFFLFFVAFPSVVGCFSKKITPFGKGDNISIPFLLVIFIFLCARDFFEPLARINIKLAVETAKRN